jgi:hypothetical protein
MALTGCPSATENVAKASSALAEFVALFLLPMALKSISHQVSEHFKVLYPIFGN